MSQQRLERTTTRKSLTYSALVVIATVTAGAYSVAPAVTDAHVVHFAPNNGVTVLIKSCFSASHDMKATIGHAATEVAAAVARHSNAVVLTAPKLSFSSAQPEGQACPSVEWTMAVPQVGKVVVWVV